MTRALVAGTAVNLAWVTPMVVIAGAPPLVCVLLITFPAVFSATLWWVGR